MVAGVWAPSRRCFVRPATTRVLVDGPSRLPRVLRRRTCRSAGVQLVAHPLSFAERPEARSLDGGNVNEGVLRAVLRRDEPVALGRVEPQFLWACLGSSE